MALLIIPLREKKTLGLSIFCRLLLIFRNTSHVVNVPERLAMRSVWTYDKFEQSTVFLIFGIKVGGLFAGYVCEVMQCSK